MVQYSLSSASEIDDFEKNSKIENLGGNDLYNNSYQSVVPITPKLPYAVELPLDNINQNMSNNTIENVRYNPKIPTDEYNIENNMIEIDKQSSNISELKNRKLNNNLEKNIDENENETKKYFLMNINPKLRSFLIIIFGSLIIIIFGMLSRKIRV